MTNSNTTLLSPTANVTAQELLADRVDQGLNLDMQLGRRQRFQPGALEFPLGFLKPPRDLRTRYRRQTSVKVTFHHRRFCGWIACLPAQ